MQFLLEQLLKTFLTLGDVIAGRVFSLMDRQTLSLSLINLTFSRCLFFASWEPVTISHYYIAFYRAPLYVVSDDLSQIADFFFLLQLLRRQAMFNTLFTSALRSHKPLKKSKCSDFARR